MSGPAGGLHIDGIVFSLQPHGGVSVVFRELLSRLGRAGVPAILSLEEPLLQPMASSDMPGVLLRHRPARLLERYRACRDTEQTAPQVFHSTYYRIPAQPGLTTVVTVHDFAYERCVGGMATRVHSWQKYAAIRRAQTIVCVSEATRDDLLDLVHVRANQRVEVIPNGVSDAFFPLEMPKTPSAGRPFVLFVGQRGRYKNFSLAASAMAGLPGMELHCVGGQPLQPAELEGLDHSISSRVKHLGPATSRELNLLYNRAACLLYPSRYEGFGIPVLEAMRAGCPVVSIACRAVVEVGGDALTVADPEPASVAAAVARTLEPEHRSAVRLRGFARAQPFSWDRAFNAQLRVYQSLGLKSAQTQPDGVRHENT